MPPSGPTPPEGTIRFSLTGPSRPFDPDHQAIRADLADIAEAEHHFAPHYSAPLPCIAARSTSLLGRPDADEALTIIATGAAFHALDVTGGWAWGYVPDGHRVGYVAAADLDQDHGATA
jgi:hypothetical protein